MTRLRISDRARQDIDAIWLYSLEQWSEHQADEYYRLLSDKMASIADNPALGLRVEVRPHLRKLPSGAHIIYYRTAPDVIEIVRILHQGMDPDRHL